MRRRHFLAGAAALPLAACSLGRGHAAAEPAAAVPLGQVRRLVASRIDPLGGRCAYRTEGAAGVFHPQRLEARSGERVELELVNQLPQPTAFHWHGLLVPEAADGAGFAPLLPGESRRVSFTVRNRAGLYWLHPHAHGFTAEQAYAGLALPLRVRDAADDALAATLQLGAANQPVLMLSDLRVRGGLVQPYAPTATDCSLGWLGNRIRVNGATAPQFACAPGWLRLQVLNASNARGLLLALGDGAGLRRFQLIGSDGGLLAAPVATDRVFLHPAERVDLLVAIAPAESLELKSLAFDARVQVEGHAPVRPHAGRGDWPTLAAAELCVASDVARTRDALPDGAAMPIARFVAAPRADPRLPPLPARLSSLTDAPTWAETQAWPLRRTRLDWAEGEGFVIDGARFDLAEAGWRIPRGSRELWEVRASPIGMPHPMHLHGAGFRVLRRQGTQGPARALALHGSGRLASDLGVKDTVTVWPGETVWLATDFSLPAEREFAGAQRYLFHCHNLEHEDAMMMRLVTLT